MAFGDLAALVRAVSRLRPPGALDPQLVQALASLLLPRPEAAGHATVRPLSDDTANAPRPVGRAPAGAADAAAATGPSRLAGDALDDPLAPKPRRTTNDPQKLVGLPSSWVQLAERADLAAPRREGAGPAPPEALALTEAPGPSAPLESLFPATRVRAILRDMATRSQPSGQPDITATVQRIARAEPIKTLPQRTRTTLGHTIVLLFDAGPTMLPFSRDKQQLAATALRLLGKDRVRVVDFLGDPMRGVRAQRQVRWEPLRWPGRGSTLVLISDLGIGDDLAGRTRTGGPGPSFFDACEHRGLRSVVLIPYGHARWPPVAARFDVALTWDLDTGVQALRRSMRQRR